MLKRIFNEFVKSIINIESTEPITFLCDKPGPVILNLERFTYTMVFSQPSMHPTTPNRKPHKSISSSNSNEEFLLLLDRLQ